MSLQCPRCHSPKVASFHHAMKITAAVGAAGGAARGVSAALAGGQTGATIGAIAGPVGIAIGSVSGAIIGGLVGGVSGCALGAQLGDKLDRHVLANNLCLLCGQPPSLPAAGAKAAWQVDSAEPWHADLLRRPHRAQRHRHDRGARSCQSA